MKFHAAELPGVWLIEPERLTDERGFFARTWCQREFAARGLDPQLVQCNISYNTHAGTLRGMHYQAAPHAETKLVRCTRGAIYDVVVDLRRDSPTFLRHIAATLSADNGLALYVPHGCAHGFLTLEDASEVFYQMGALYVSEAARGARWDDPAFAIQWPGAVRVISERDRTYENFELD